MEAMNAFEMVPEEYHDTKLHKNHIFSREVPLKEGRVITADDDLKYDERIFEVFRDFDSLPSHYKQRLQRTHYQRLQSFLRPLLEATGLRLAHVGGTSVPGLAAQPVIDAIIGPHPNQLLDTNSLASMLRELGFRQDEDDELLFDKTSRLQFMHQLRICATAVDFQQQLDARNACAGLSPQQIHDLNLRKHEAARLYPNSPEDYDRAKRG